MPHAVAQMLENLGQAFNNVDGAVGRLTGKLTFHYDDQPPAQAPAVTVHKIRHKIRATSKQAELAILNTRASKEEIPRRLNRIRTRMAELK